MISAKIHRAVTRIVIWLGPRNWFVRVLLKNACARHDANLKFAEQWIEISRGSQCVRVASSQFPYLPDIALHFDTYFGQLMSEQVGQQLVVDCSKPKLQRYRKSGLEFELASLPEESEAIESYFRSYRPSKGDLIFDVGAYCGVSTYFLSQVVGPEGRVVSFEPDPTAFELLKANVGRHSLTNVVPVNAAIAASSGTALFCSEANLGSGLKHELSRASAGRTCKVETMTLADACARFGVPSFAKIDIEGAEVAVLSSARSLLTLHTINLVLDTNHWVDGKRTDTAVEAILRDCGYTVRSSEDSGFMTTWGVKSNEAKVATAGLAACRPAKQV